MNITDIRIRRVNSAGRMKAVVSVTFDDQFVVHDIKVVEGNNGYFVAMPSRKGADGEFRDVAHPITTETRNMLQTMILEAYNQLEVAEEA
ncbi:MAG: septation regulator SpoVG [Firmicutes bacterium]|nr:septation regulator SpoVG [Bacillota bacterium]HOB35372.1 septation regulator SpoVG [Bacillota bacterium]HPZ91323.1 septation regulator SpoVG [Bacillota bacterium]HQE02437.1 septation regulator SpoVG [Bacillota bacterium]